MQKTTIYVSHSSSSNYKEEIYKPLRNSKLNQIFNIIFPHGNSKEQYNSKSLFKKNKNLFILAELSHPSIGRAMELGMGYMMDLPIIGIHKCGQVPSKTEKSHCKTIIEYHSLEHIIPEIEQEIYKLQKPKIPTKEIVEGVFEFLKEANILKYRQRFDFTDCTHKDSPAAHTWRAIIMAYVFKKIFNLDIDLLKTHNILAFHDLAEAKTGDLDYKKVHLGLVKEDAKNSHEKAALKEIIKTLPKEIQQEITGFKVEYETGSSVEGLLAKAIDKLEATSSNYSLGNKRFNQSEIIISYSHKHVERVPEIVPFLICLQEKLKLRFQDLNIPWKEEYNFTLPPK